MWQRVIPYFFARLGNIWIGDKFYLKLLIDSLCFPCIGAVLLKSNPRSVPCFSIVASRGSEERSPPGEL